MNGRIIPMPMGNSVVFVVMDNPRRWRRHTYLFTGTKIGDEEWLYLKYKGVCR